VLQAEGRIVLGSMCVGVSVWLGWSGIRVAGFSLQHGYLSTPDDGLYKCPKHVEHIRSELK